MLFYVCDECVNWINGITHNSSFWLIVSFRTIFEGGGVKKLEGWTTLYFFPPDTPPSSYYPPMTPFFSLPRRDDQNYYLSALPSPQVYYLRWFFHPPQTRRPELLFFRSNNIEILFKTGRLLATVFTPLGNILHPHHQLHPMRLKQEISHIYLD